MIKPTIGRVVWVYRPHMTNDPQQPEAAFIAYVWNDRLINVGGFSHGGSPFYATSVQLLQDDDPKPEGNHATWMPFQVGQAKAQEASADAIVHPTKPPNPTPNPVPGPK